MEDQVTPDQVLCASCHTTNAGNAAYCKRCNYPFWGTEEEQKNFVSSRGVADIEMTDLQRKIKTAGNTLLVLAGFAILWGIIWYFINKDEDAQLAFVTLIVYLLLAGIYVGLSLWSKKRPAAALISGLSLYILIIVLDFVADPSSIAKGIIFKVFLIGYMIKGIRSAFEAEKLRKEYNID